MMLIQRICMAFRGLGNCMSVDRAIRVRAAILLSPRQHKLHIMLNMCTIRALLHVAKNVKQVTNVLSWNRTKLRML
jgi:hypothetical protein